MLCHENQDVGITFWENLSNWYCSFLFGVGMGILYFYLKGMLLGLAVLMFAICFLEHGFSIDVFINTFAKCTYYHVSAKTAGSVFSCHWSAPENICKNNQIGRNDHGQYILQLLNHIENTSMVFSVTTHVNNFKHCEKRLHHQASRRKTLVDSTRPLEKDARKKIYFKLQKISW